MKKHRTLWAVRVALVAACGVGSLPARAVTAAGQGIPQVKPIQKPQIVLPTFPPSLSVETTDPIYEYTKIALKLRIDHYPYADLDLNRLPRQLGNFKQMNVSYGAPQPTRAADGSVTFSLIGYFQGGSSVSIRTVNPSSNPDSSTLSVSGHVTLAPRVTYTVTDTWTLKDRFAPRLLSSGIGSFCDGQPPVGSALGIQQFNGKLSFLGRSGPAGTSCSFGLKELLVADGIVGAHWTVIHGGPAEQCVAGGSPVPTRVETVVSDTGAISNSVFFSDANQVIDSGVIYAANNGDPVTVLRPAIVSYTCPITLGSDVRTIRVVLDSVTMLAAPGRRFP